VTLVDDENLTSHLGWTDWMFNYKIGVGTFGTIFLEKVQARGMEYPELWAVKRMPRNLSNFPSKQFQYEIKNLQALSNVCFCLNARPFITGIGLIQLVGGLSNVWTVRVVRQTHHFL